MEFLLFLDKVEIDILRMVEKVGYRTEENTPLCLLGKDYVGFLKKRKKRIVICTDNAKRREGYKQLRKNRDRFHKTAIHIKKALRHEAVHVAQGCNNGNLLEIDKNLSINPAKVNALEGSTKISGERKKEIQAYILEDKPNLIKKQLKKYCL